ncbi:hypothetical protein SK128_003323, partial [Halocaridina rubra]
IEKEGPNTTSRYLKGYKSRLLTECVLEFNSPWLLVQLHSPKPLENREERFSGACLAR